MKQFFSKIKEALTAKDDDEHVSVEGEGKQDEGYVELDTEVKETKSKLVVRPFVLKEFDDIKTILDSLREGYTIALVNIKPLKDKDIVELKRAINKLKKTCDAIEGEIAGFGEDWIVVVPSFVKIYKSRSMSEVEAETPAQ